MGKSKYPLTAGNEIEGLKPYEVGETIRKGPAYRLYQNKLYSFAGTFPFTTTDFDTELTAEDWVLELSGGGSVNAFEEQTYAWNTGDPKIFTVTDSSKITDVYINGRRLEKFATDGTTPEEWKVNSETEIEIIIPIGDGDRISIVKANVTGLAFDQLTQAEKDSLKGSDANVTSENIENSTGVKIEKKAESSIIHSYGNLVNSNAAASSILNGTVSDPNILGKKVILKYFIGDGVNKTFNIGTDFTVNNVDWNNIRVLKIRDYDGANYTYLENNGFVVNNYGTNSIDIIMDSPVEENYTLEVCILSEEDDPNSNNNLITILGYDNVVNSIMSNAFGAHGVINSGEGHNTILGGSYGKIWGSFNALFGKNINIGKDDNASSFNFGIGMSNYINGGFNNVLGQNNTISGNRNSVFSTNGLIDNFDDCTLFGNRPKALGDGDFVKGAGYSLDSEPGLYQSREIFFRGETTNDIETFLMLTTGATTAEVADNSSSLVRIEVTAMLENGSKVAIYESSNILTKLAGVSKIDNLVTDVNIPMVKNIGNPNWIAELRAIVGGVRVRITGEPSGKVRWLAKLTMNQIKF